MLNLSPKHYFFSQPHQPFFALAVVNAIIFMSLFALSMGGYVSLEFNPITLHSYSMIYLLFTPAFLGFLLTTFTRFSQMPPLTQKEYMKVFYPLSIATVLFLLGAFGSIYLIYLAKLLILFAEVYALFIFINIYKASPTPDKHDQFWIITAWSMGIVANLLSFIGTINFSKTAVYSYMIFLALSIAQRMVPFFTHVMIERDKNLMRNIFILFLITSILSLFNLDLGGISLIVAGVLLAKEMIRWKLPFFKNEPIIWILHIAIYWLPVGLIMGGVSLIAQMLFKRSFLALDLHLVLLGFLTTILIGFGTRVTLGHSGNRMVIDTATKVIFYLTQIVLYFRIIYSFSGSLVLFYISVALFISIFLAWGIKYLPVILSGKRL